MEVFYGYSLCQMTRGKSKCGGKKRHIWTLRGTNRNRLALTSCLETHEFHNYRIMLQDCLNTLNLLGCLVPTQHFSKGGERLGSAGELCNRGLLRGALPSSFSTRPFFPYDVASNNPCVQLLFLYPKITPKQLLQRTKK